MLARAPINSSISGNRPWNQGRHILNQNPEEKSRFTGFDKILVSPTIVFSLILIAVYIIVGSLVGDFFNPITTAIINLANGSSPNSGSIVVFYLAQCQDPGPLLPWTVLTSMFLHAGILHIASNILFLIFFGFILEEHLTKTRWVATFLLTGFVGNLTFAGAGFAGLLGPTCGVGASGAVYGIMGTALGLRAAILIIFLAGLDIFAGGGFFAHFGGLITGFVLRHFWISRSAEV